MHKLLSRFAWGLSFVAWFVVTFILATMIGALDRGIDNDSFFTWIIVSGIFGIIIKSMFFDVGFIQSSLSFFAKRIKEDIVEEGLSDREISAKLDQVNLRDKIKKETLESLDETDAKQLQGDTSGMEVRPWFVINSTKKVEDIGKLEVQEKLESWEKDQELQSDSEKSMATEQSGVQIDNWNEKYDKRPTATADIKTHTYEDRLEKQKPAEPNAFQKFFAENTMAKIWGILVFLAVLFFLKLIYAYIWDVTKLIIGFLTGFALVGTGIFLDKKWLKNESMVLMGTWFLVNYLVILAGRYLLGTSTAPLLWETLTFFFLILNTILAVITSLVYKSPTLLLFSFIIAYINPFLIWIDSTTPYVIGWYAMIVSFGWFILSNSFSDKEDLSRTLNYVAVFWGIGLLLLSPFSLVLWWMFKLVGIWIVSLISIFIAYRTKSYKDMWILFTLAYISFLFLMWTGSSVLGAGFQELTVYIAYMSYIVIIWLASVLAFVSTRIISILGLVALPVVMLVVLISSGHIFYVIPTLLLVTILLLIGFVSLFAKLTEIFKYGFFVLLAWFILLISSFLWETSVNLWMYQTVWVFITSIIFLLTAYYYSSKEKLEYLYTLWTIATIFMIMPLIKMSGETMEISIAIIIVLWIFNMVLPFLNTTLLKSNIRNLSFGLISWILFLAFQLYNFGDIYFPGVELWLAFLWLAVIYFVLSYFMTLKLEVNLKEESPDSSPARNVVYSILGVSISLFSLAMVFVFSSQAEIISVAWLFEACILFFFYQRVKDEKVYAAAIVLFFIGIMSLFRLIPLTETWDYLSLVSLAMIFGSFVANIKFLENIDNKTKGPHDILHVLWILAIWSILIEIVPHLWQWWHILAMSVFMVILWLIYFYFKAENLRKVFYVTFMIFLGVHVLNVSYILSTSDWLPFVQYLSSLVLLWVPVLINQMKNDEDDGGKWISNAIVVAFVLYSLIISTIYVYDFFQDTFVITMYWGILTAITLFYGISSDKVRFRTIWLYILVLTVGKLLLIDIWYGLDEPILRVVALMAVGILMIVISIAYNKKYDGKMAEEFDLGNLVEKEKL